MLKKTGAAFAIGCVYVVYGSGGWVARMAASSVRARAPFSGLDSGFVGVETRGHGRGGPCMGPCVFGGPGPTNISKRLLIFGRQNFYFWFFVSAQNNKNSRSSKEDNIVRLDCRVEVSDGQGKGLTRMGVGVNS